ncbi:MAG: efflux RND transporter permease subunit [Gammaproteobacteria bacterium]|nr:efflux RND transporter permease subunit [Gammaproteobacteria bacterium]MDP6616633.1 efflux RND transporter permease subunit [Gammaproteobacteria bacterium]MDP6695227.1 efflux RND transporter permease subunit [Gammaproteobacteria bacterium]
MWLSDVSVKRPVFATVIAMLLVAFGSLAFNELAVREYPDISAPVISVTVGYPGASAEVVESRITQILEREVSGIEGAKSITSSSLDGQSSISVEFSLERKIDEAANDVRDRVGRVVTRLPDDIDAPIIAKQDADAQPIMYINLESPNLSEMDLTDYAERYVRDRLAVVPGVSQVQMNGLGRPSMRVWLDRIALAARGLTVTDIENALRRENLELPAGRVDSKDREFQVRVARNFTTAEEFRRLVIGQGTDGHLIRLGEVANVEVAPRDSRTIFRTNGQSSVGFGIIKQSTANTVDVITGINAEVARITPTLPQGMQLAIGSDDSAFIRAAIRSVYITIAITTALVGLVILAFLGNVRAMLIPVTTIPVCLVASFMVLALFGFSINLVTLLALVLSIGLVVDDSIVVLENVHRRIENGEPPLLAAFKGTRQVAFAVIATTAVLVAVFAPIAFLRDNIGRIFSELAVTVVAAVVFSSVLALSLAPMMCSKLLRPGKRENRGMHMLDRFFENLAESYQRGLEASLNAPRRIVLMMVVIAASVWGLMENLPEEYAPGEDQGMFFAIMQAAEGTSVDHMRKQVEKFETPMRPLIQTGDIQRSLIRTPIWGSTNPNGGIIIVTMAPWGEREVSTAEAQGRMMASWSQIPEVRSFSFMRSGISRHGGGQPVQFVIGGSDYDELARWRDIVLARARANPGLTRVDADLKETQPQLNVRIDQDRAAALGVSVQSIGQTLRTMMGEQVVTTYVVDGEEYDVVLHARQDQRATATDLTNIYVRQNRSRNLIPLSNLVTTEDTAGSGRLNRYNRLRALTISATPVPGYALGDALEFLEDVVRSELPTTARVDYKGESLEYKESAGATYFTFGIALLVVFLVLAAQFESFVHPLIIMVTVPLALAGGLLGLSVMGKTLNIYSQIGVVMLIGIAAKNGVLIVEFINQLRDEGMEFAQAIVEGARIRFRPVVMTTVSTLMGSIPLMLATGPGSESRSTLGIIMFWGVSIAAAFTLFVVPVFYKMFAKGTSTPEAVANKLEALQAND